MVIGSVQNISKSLRALFWTGKIRLESKYFEEAIESFSKCIDEAEGGRQLCVYIKRAQTYVRMKEYEKAYEDAETALEDAHDDDFQVQAEKCKALIGNLLVVMIS